MSGPGPTMHAVFFRTHGDVDCLKYGELPTPRPQANEVRVRVSACGVNHLDLWTRAGMPGVTIPLPHVLGCEIVGTVDAWGAGVSGLTRGQRVLVSPGVNCGWCAACTAGRDSLCREYRLMGFQVDGGYAEYAVAPATAIVPLQGGPSDEAWAAVPLVFLTAWHMLFTRGRLAPGETALIHAAGSGVGSAAIQLAKWAGARVVTTARGADKLRKASALGADEVIDYSRVDFAQRAKELTGGQGADLVFEHIGTETWERSLASLRPGGRLVTCGATSGPRVEVDLRYLFVRELSVSGCYMGGRHELLRVLELIEQGAVQPVVDTVFPLREAAEAHRRMASRQLFGKLVLAAAP